jgi:hypothetical protein
MEAQAIREALEQQLDAAYTRFEQTLDRVSAAQTTAPNVVGAWTPKDVLAHMIYWQQLPVHELNAALRGERYSEDGSNSDEVNARTVAESQQTDWETLRAEFRKAHQAVIERIRSLPDAAFDPDGIIEQALNDSVVGALAGNTWEHYDLHGAQLRDWLDTQ